MVSTRTLELFVGAFKLLSITRTQNGAMIADITYGETPAGVISYTPSGFMSAVLTATDPSLRPENLTLPALPNQTDHEWAEIGRHTLAYAGPYYFNESKASADGSQGEIIHGPLITSTLPSFVGSLQHREFNFTEGGKFLNLIGNLGNGIIDNLKWERLERDISFT